MSANIPDSSFQASNFPVPTDFQKVKMVISPNEEIPTYNWFTGTWFNQWTLY